MPSMPTIRLMRPVATVYLIPETELRIDPTTANPQSAIMSPPAPAGGRNAQSEHLHKEFQEQQDELAGLLATLNEIIDSLHTFHEQAVASHPAEIAKLAVEIARRILRHKVDTGDYEIQGIVEEALQESPTQQNVVIHLNPDDLPSCQELQRQNPQSPFAGLELTADRTIGHGECLVETPKGIVRSFIAERLERISEALQKVK